MSLVKFLYAIAIISAFISSTQPEDFLLSGSLPVCLMTVNIFLLELQQQKVEIFILLIILPTEYRDINKITKVLLPTKILLFAWIRQRLENFLRPLLLLMRIVYP